MAKFEVFKNFPDRVTSEEYSEVIEAKNIGVSNGVLYLMGDSGNIAIFGRDYWTRCVRLEDE
jgi:hypothetical protein